MLSLSSMTAGLVALNRRAGVPLGRTQRLSVTVDSSRLVEAQRRAANAVDQIALDAEFARSLVDKHPVAFGASGIRAECRGSGCLRSKVPGWRPKRIDATAVG